MALELKTAPEGLMSDAELAAWHDIPPAVISDELNRTGAMAAAIKPLAPGMKVVGQALTVQTMVGDNAALHYCLTVAWPGAVSSSSMRVDTWIRLCGAVSLPTLRSMSESPAWSSTAAFVTLPNCGNPGSPCMHGAPSQADLTRDGAVASTCRFNVAAWPSIRVI
jgi:hypothetical protein